jgi:hypothetical protein
MTEPDSPLACASIGWNLDSPHIVPLEPDSPGQLDQVDAIFLSIDRVSDLWARAVGHPLKSFRSSVFESEAWQRLSHFNRQLQRFLARGGLLVCRLDLPTSRCQVRFRPDDEGFPAAFELNAYRAIAPAHPALAALAEGAGQLTVPEFELIATNHPVGQYLSEFAHTISPVVGITRLVTAEEVAHSATGHSVALAWDQVLAVPPAPGVDSLREAASLLDVVRQTLGREASPGGGSAWFTTDLSGAMADLSMPGIDHLRQLERQLSAQIRQLEARRDLVRRRRASREELNRLLPVTDSSKFKVAVIRALEVLGFPIAKVEHAIGVWLAGEAETLPNLLGRETGYLLRGRLRADAQRDRKVTFYAPAGAQSAEDKPDSAPSQLFADRAQRQGEALVPIGELLDAAGIVLMSPHDEPIVERVRRSLTDCLGLYRFDLAQAIDPAERDVLLGSTRIFGR